MLPRDGLFPPNVKLEVDVTAVQDVLLRTYVADAPTTLVTTDHIADLTLSSAPPAGAVVGPSFEHVPGTLTLFRPLGALVALPDAGGAATLRFGMWMKCSGYAEVRAALVASDGKATSFAPTCGTAPEARALAVPGPGPLWLSFSDLSGEMTPDSYPAPRGVERLALGPLTFTSP